MQFIETIYHSPVGPIFLRANSNALLELTFISTALPSSAAPSSHTESSISSHPPLALTVQWLDQYFSGHQPNFVPPFQLNVTPFTQRVLEIASLVPFGSTMTYGEIAEIIAAERGLFKMSARAVGSAMGRNPICLIIPCHRIIGANHHLGGYNGQTDRKRQLLAHEGVDSAALV